MNWMTDNVFGTGSEDCTAKLWSADKLENLRVMEFNSRVTAIVFTNKNVFMSCHERISICDHDFNNKHDLATRKVYDMLVTKDGKTVITATSGKKHINFVDITNDTEFANIY